ncbi:hypothetical protein QYE76_006464 [Lolium multiflorum]|uniref:F-box domain-containing protein n=1 Tax=Lolium multiflorum TaxID=4521 RepID=A0AAD8W3B8_LOLMU|nr:hypothetical protein QYE76_006464 [Lolium multiflorum]
MADLYVPPEIVYEVLLRVPAAYVSRLRGVSPLWKATIDCPLFRDAHRRRRPPMLLVFSRADHVSSDLSNVELNEFDADEREPRRLLRFAAVTTPAPLRAQFPELQALGATPDSIYKVEGSFAGVILVSSADTLYASNPVTRRWARLPPIHLHRGVMALYGVGTDDFRVLFSDGIGGCSVFDLASRVTRHIGTPTLPGSPPGLALLLGDGLRQDGYDDPPVYLDNHLYWRPQISDQGLHWIVGFHVQDEVFGWLNPPSIRLGKRSSTVDVDILFQIRGTLAAASLDLTTMTVNTWIRQRPTWLPGHRVHLPAEAIASHAYTIEGMTNNLKVFIVSDRLDVLVQLPRAALHTDRRGCIIKFHNNMICTPHRFESNLHVQECLPQSSGDDEECEDNKFFDFDRNTRQ